MTIIGCCLNSVRPDIIWHVLPIYWASVGGASDYLSALIMFTSQTNGAHLTPQSFYPYGMLAW